MHRCIVKPLKYIYTYADIYHGKVFKKPEIQKLYTYVILHDKKEDNFCYQNQKKLIIKKNYGSRNKSK